MSQKKARFVDPIFIFLVVFYDILSSSLYSRKLNIGSGESTKKKILN